MNTKVIFFDVYQTLLNVDSDNEKANMKTAFDQVLIPYLQQKGISETDASLLPARYSDEVQVFYKDHDKTKQQHDFPTILSHTFNKYYAVDIAETEMTELLYSFRKISRGYLKIYDGVRETLEKLSKQYTLIVASHTQGVFTERELEELDIRQYFKQCVYSSDIGFKKTSDEFWRKCLDVAESAPQDCVMVGDNLLEDMFMANRHNIHTIWILNPLTKDKFQADVEPEARLPVESWKDLPGIIKNIWNS